MNVLIINAYSVKNRGDAGIVVSMIRQIKKMCPAASIGVMSAFHEDNRPYYSRFGAISVPPVWQIQTDRSRPVRFSAGVARCCQALFFPKSKAFEPFRNTDLILAAGGGYLYSSGSSPLGLGLTNALFHIWLGTRFGKPVVCFPQSVGPFIYATDVRLAKYVLRKVDCLMSREPISTELLREMGIIESVKEIPDVAFTLTPGTSVLLPEETVDELRVGVTPLDWSFARRHEGEKVTEQYLAKLGAVLTRLTDNGRSGRVFILPQVTVDKGLDVSDEHIAEELHHRLGSDVSTIVHFAEDVVPEDIVATYGDMNIVIAGRMHSTVFSYAAGTLAVTLAYQPKATGTMRLLGLDEFCIDIESFEEDELMEMANRRLKSDQKPDSRSLRNQITQDIASVLARYIKEGNHDC